ncbi:hypothetical protein CEXT_801501 [Caerostris extrusa]|uniref:Uncharacterized protein n=1 Tax=Caerostris extrusa TaxID=172846 RepID=A0AAV4UZC3_CAEEX|nr:hypothetical protein CEXT_801501 [Caerostris extrusa]
MYQQNGKQLNVFSLTFLPRKEEVPKDSSSSCQLQMRSKEHLPEISWTNGRWNRFAHKLKAQGYSFYENDLENFIPSNPMVAPVHIQPE